MLVSDWCKTLLRYTGADTDHIQALALNLTALEENLAEYKAIRKDLQLIFDVVVDLNLSDDLENLLDDLDTNAAAPVGMSRRVCLPLPM